MVKYEFIFKDGKKLEFEVNPERPPAATNAPAESWAKLEHCKCSHCPLDAAQYPNCPAAVDLQPVIQKVAALPASDNVRIAVVSKERAIVKDATLEEGLRALMGLVMSTSACPVLEPLRPMGLHHLPFNSTEEFILRSVSFYLLRQYLLQKDGAKPDWELKGLVKQNQDLQTLNQDFWKRFQGVCKGDGALKALMGFFSLSSSVSYSMELQIQKLRRKFLGNRPPGFQPPA